MLRILACLGGVFVVFLTAEWLWRKKILHGEYLRKFGHISNATFIASWPWIISFRAITWLGVALLAGVLINRIVNRTHLLGGIDRSSFGDIFFALAVIACSLITDEKIFFAIAMLHMGWADGLAALVGVNFGKRWGYKIWGQLKTIFGSMIFWIVSMEILAAAVLLGGHDLFSFSQFALIILLLPPILTVIEGFGIFGLDNLTVPVAAVIALQLIQG